MFARLKLLAALFAWPLRVLVRCHVVTTPGNEQANTNSKPLFYITKVASASDLATLQRVCLQQGLPDPTDWVELSGHRIPRTLFLESAHSLAGRQSDSGALQQGQLLLQLHEQMPSLTASLIPVSVNWGRAPGKEASVRAIVGEPVAPNWLRKLLIVLISGRHTLVQFSQAVDIGSIARDYGSSADTAHKMLRMARFHFYRQQLAANGPRQPDRQALFNALLAAPAVRQAIETAAAEQQISIGDARTQALQLLQEIAADPRESTIRVGERFLRWLFGRLYTGLQINNNQQIRELAQRGHEIVYLPCHRSHMDYLLLSYVIYQQGLASPHIAAGINLNFWPVGKMFRRGGAFFIRRSFSGNKLYSVIFREYLTQLFRKGYAVKYYSEGGRSRTGRLLAPKTGMLAMTLQSMLRGIDRPVTLVPVYLGYEHVMEVSTYLRELTGSQKTGESVGGVVKAIGKLRNYGYGYVNFGEPLTLNHYLNQQVPDWKTEINPDTPAKPGWLNPAVADVAHLMMLRINQAAAVNSITLLATCLLAQPQQLLPERQLLQQLDLYLQMLRQARYHPNITICDGPAEQLLAHAIRLGKVEKLTDPFGNLIRFAAKDQQLMSYYRNNISHLFILPSLVMAALLHQPQSAARLTAAANTLQPLLEHELHYAPADAGNYLQQLLQFFCQHGLLTHDNSTTLWRLNDSHRASAELLAQCSDAILIRYGMILHLLRSAPPMDSNVLEQRSHELALRLARLHNLHSPEFNDKKLFSTLISALKSNQYLSVEAELLTTSPTFAALDQLVLSLMPAAVAASIVQIST